MLSLFNGRLCPITYSCGFLECDLKTAVDAYLDWQRPLQGSRGVELIQSALAGTLEQVLLHLMPLTNVEARRFLFIPTASPWTMYLDNGHRSTDAFPPMSYLATILKCRALRVMDTPEQIESTQYPARILEIYGPEQTGFLNTIRSIADIYDGYRWQFSATGEIQPFEQPERYTVRTIKDRFTSEMLQSYLAALGIDTEDETFYRASAAILIQKQGPAAPKIREFSLAQSR